MNPSAESHAKVGRQFTNACSEWEDGTYTKFREWIKVQYGMQSQDSEDEGPLPARQQRSKDIIFKKDPQKGFRVLPKRDGHTVKDMQRTVRAYIGTCYRKYSGCGDIASLRPFCWSKS